MKIYLDVDGTLADFWGHATARGVEPLGNVAYLAGPSTWTPEQKARQDAIDGYMRDENFWMTIPPMPGAFELISTACSRADTYLLTAYPAIAKNDDALQDMIRKAKLHYAMDVLHFPANKVIVCNRSEKVRHAGLVPNLLVDDAEQNCSEWRSARGVAIFHSSVPSSIRELKRLYIP